jgi:predicted nucleic-acid-binding Zn-ribbon protein
MTYVGPMNPEQARAKIEEVTRLLRERGTLSTCPRCGKNDWRADLLGYFVSTLPVTGLTVPPPHVPVLNLTCNNCGYMELHNLSILGITL